MLFSKLLSGQRWTETSGPLACNTITSLHNVKNQTYAPLPSRLPLGCTIQYILWRWSQMFDHDPQESFKYCIFSIRCLWQFEMVLQSPIKNNCLKCSVSTITMCKETRVNLPVQPEPRLPGKHMFGFLRSSGHYISIHQSICDIALQTPYIVCIMRHFHWM